VVTDTPRQGKESAYNAAPGAWVPDAALGSLGGVSLENAATTRDAFLDGAVMLEQPRRGYRAGIDAVVLAAAAQPQDGRTPLRVLDAGAGVGTVGLLAAYRLRKLIDIEVTLVERAPELAALAARNACNNALEERVGIICADFLGPVADLEQKGLASDSFDLVLANPPFHVEARGTMSANMIKAGANAMGEGDLERWARAMARVTRPGGEIVVIHKADALPELLSALVPRFGALRIMPLYPRVGAPASRILIKGIKGSRAPLTLLPGGPLHGEGHAFTSPVTAILRHGAGLEL